MDWTSLLNIALGGTSVVAIIAAIIYRKQNRDLKNNEVKKDNAETQEKEINLAELYKDKMLELMEQVRQKQDSGNENQHRILEALGTMREQISTMDGRLDKVEGSISDIVIYLDGDYQDYLMRRWSPKKEVKPKTKTKRNEKTN